MRTSLVTLGLECSAPHSRMFLCVWLLLLFLVLEHQLKFSCLEAAFFSSPLHPHAVRVLTALSVSGSCSSHYYSGLPRLLYSSPMLLSPSAVHTLAHFRWLSYECGDFYFFFFLNHSSFLVSRTALDIQWPLNKVLLNGGRALLIIFTGVII